MDIRRININVGGVGTPGYTGGDEALDQIAAKVGRTLPEGYMEFLRAADGGHPEIGCFSPQGSDTDNYFDVDWFYSVANPKVESVGQALKNWGKLLGQGALPIGRDGGGNQIYLFLDDSPPSVWLYLHDEQGKRLKIADSLEEFFDELKINPDFI